MSSPVLLELYDSPEGRRARAEIEDGPFCMRFGALEVAPDCWRVRLDDCAGKAVLLTERREVRGDVAALQREFDDWGALWREDAHLVFAGLGRT